MQALRLLILLLLGAFIFISCNKGQKKEPANIVTQKQVNEKLLHANALAVEVENRQIEDLIKSAGWKMTKTATGLRYQILEKSDGPKAVFGKIARIEYEIKLLAGEVIYSSAISGLKEFRIGSGGVESGLEEGILLLNLGDKARFVMPSYLAHGLSGDQDKIPPKATLIYTLKLTDLK
jgi:FKBP-type peptidyl-prolyl cis-trans isomerase